MCARLGFLALALMCGAACPAPGAQARIYGDDLAGRPVTSLAPAGSRAVVLFFVASDCPISNRYMPEMHRLEEEFAARGAVFWFVYPNVTETAATVRAHEAAYGPSADAHGRRVVTDPQQQLARLAGAIVTPEAAILLPDKAGLRTVYTGRIDDRYLSIGNERPQATRHDLERAIEAALSGRPVPPPGGPAVGCQIVSMR